MNYLKALIIIVLIPILTRAQGIPFEQNLSWSEVRAKAKKENKYIFLDIFATWCVPCKMMEKQVYANDSVGAYFSSQFISVKVQMDQTKSDNAMVRSWYATADSLKTAYDITAYPTILFLSPNGNIVLKSVGYSSAQEFYELAIRAADPKENYTGLLREFNSNKLPLSRYASLAITAQKISDTANANRIAKAYKTEYLNTLTEDQVKSKENLNFIVKFYNIVDSKDKSFNFLYEHPQKADSILGTEGISQSIVNIVITKEEAFKYTGEKENPKSEVMNSTKIIEPDWKKMKKNISSKYNLQVAENIVLSSKLRWYESKKDWSNFVETAIQQLEAKKQDTSENGRIAINSTAYSIIFKYSNNPRIIDKGISWMKVILKHNPSRYSWIDTYANLLYKRGRKNEAIVYQKKAVELAKTKDEADYQELKSNLTKMIQGKPTWTEN